jgi:tetratricopeptide (TPR) repeat protein
MGLNFDNIGQPQKALDSYNQALPIEQEVKNRSGEATILTNIAYLEHKDGDEDLALANIQKAIAIQEQLRTAIVAQELRTSYFATVQDSYKLYIDILMHLHKQHPSQGYDAQALQISERDRARSQFRQNVGIKYDLYASGISKLGSSLMGSLGISGSSNLSRWTKCFSIASTRFGSGTNTLLRIALISASMVCPCWTARCSKSLVISGSSW